MRNTRTPSAARTTTSSAQAATTTPGAAATSAAATTDAAANAPLHRAELAVRWRDLDAFNHVNNASYLTYLEEARLQWFATLGDAWMSATVAPVLAASQLNYRRPVEWPAVLAVELAVERLGSTSLTLSHRIVAHDDASLVYCDGSVVLVWFDRTSGRPASVPDVVRAACSPTQD